MKRFLILSIVLVLANTGFAQKSSILTDHYKNEYQTFKEFVKYSQTVKGDTNIDVKFYYIDIEIGIYTHFVGGNVTCRFTPLVADLNTININLNSSMTVDSVSSPCESFYHDNDLLIITLDNNFNPGDLIDITIYYHGVPVLAGGYKGLRYELHASGEPIIATLSTPYLAHYWYPCKDGPQDKPDSMYMDITIPDEIVNGQPLMAISNGVLENVIDNGDTRTFQWRHRYPIVTYYIMAAVSNYVHFQEIFNGTGGESFPLDYYVFQESLNSSQTGVTNLPEVIQFYSDVFGPYPFREEKYGMTQLGFYGAIENQTNTITNNMSSSWFYTSIHELGHMWFGDMITLANWHHCWLNEGFATYSEALWDEYKYGFEAYKTNMSNNEYWGGGTLYLQNAADTFNTFQSIFYTKGAYTVHMLRGVLGDVQFFDALLNYSQDPDFMYKNASTEDLQASFEASSGMDLDFFFDEWVYDERFPVYHYNYAQNTNNDLFVVIYQAQEELFGYRPLFEMPVRIKANFIGGGDTTFLVWNDEQTQQFNFSTNEAVSSVEIDPDKWILRQTLYQPNLPVGLDENASGSLIRVYPNPFNDVVQIFLGEQIQSNISIRIIDLKGRLIYNLSPAASFTNSISWNGCDLSGKRLEPGIYLLQVSTGKSTFARKLILTD